MLVLDVETEKGVVLFDMGMEEKERGVKEFF